MTKEKKFILINRIVWGGLLLLSFILLILSFVPRKQKPFEIVEDNGTIDEYYQYLDMSEVSITVKFNQSIEDATVNIDVKFYDEEGNYLAEKTCYAMSLDIDGDTATFDFSSVSGKVAQYEIVDFSITFYSSNNNYWLLYPASFMIIIFLTLEIESLFLHYNIYEVNGVKIMVYAGYFANYMKIDDKKVDDRTVTSHIVPITLSTTLEDGTKIEAIISAFNRMAFKANDKLITPEKGKKHE